MLFNSWEFAIFFPVVTILYFSLPASRRWAWLLFASCFFYAAYIPKYLLILAFVILFDYGAGRCIERCKGRRRKLVLCGSIACNLGVLFFFKYANFLNSNLAQLAQFLHWNYPYQQLAFLLPLGLSFHTFQSMSYTIEVYRGEYKAERHLGVFALYVMFYPQLLAGPIEPPQRLLPQLHSPKPFERERLRRGILLMAGGFFKKMVIADNLAGIVNPVFSEPTAYTALPLLVAIYAFGFQVLCDFSGYSDIARGAAEVMGFDLSLNFNKPFLSKSVAEFWTRWHISLYEWFREYLYFPLALKAGESVILQSLCLILVFVASGLWHGASWTYLLWGAIHGLYLTASRPLRPLRQWVSEKTKFPPKLRQLFAILTTFHLIAFTWIFFRAESLEEAFYIIRALFHWNGGGPMLPLYPHYSDRAVGICLILMFLVICGEVLQVRDRLRELILVQPRLVRWCAYLIFAIAFLLLIDINEVGPKPFVYFEF